jgi:hypothetical protein
MDKTIQMARESWIDVYGLGHERVKFIDALKHFEALVRADEREEINRRANASWTLMCEKMVAAERESILDLVDDYAKNNTDLIAAIRARGNT